MSSDLEIEEGLSYKELLKIYSDNFSLGYLNTDFKSKMALISLICDLTRQMKIKKPDVTHYQVIQSIAKNEGLPDSFIKSLAVVCNDFAYGCTEFPTFNLSNKEMIATVKNLLNKYTPF